MDGYIFSTSHVDHIALAGWGKYAFSFVNLTPVLKAIYKRVYKHKNAGAPGFWLTGCLKICLLGRNPSLFKEENRN